MKLTNRIVICLFALAFLAGCAAQHGTITARQEYQGGKVARPDHIYVYDFAATPGDVPPDSAMAGLAARSMPPTPEQIAAGRQAGAKIAQVLVQEIRGMGLPAMPGNAQTPLQIGDLVLRGYIVSMDEGDAAKRVAIGFGAGASHLKTTVEGYLVTERGLERLGSGTDEVGGSKAPGTAVAVAGAVATGNPAGLIISSAMKVHGEKSGSSTVQGRAEDTAKDIARELKVKFKQQGWI
jgi:hypothetical protein